MVVTRRVRPRRAASLRQPIASRFHEISIWGSVISQADFDTGIASGICCKCLRRRRPGHGQESIPVMHGLSTSRVRDRPTSQARNQCRTGDWSPGLRPALPVSVLAFGRHCQDPMLSSPGLRPALRVPVPASPSHTQGSRAKNYVITGAKQ